MNKQDFVKLLAQEAELTGRQAAQAVDSMVEIIMEQVAAGEKIQFSGFGTFERKERKARTGRNPRTNEPVPIPATAVPAFTPGSVFKEKVER